MEGYKCRRCGYKGKLKHHLIAHLNRKTKCNPIIEDVSIDTLMSEIDNKLGCQIYKCNYCCREFNDKSNLSRHCKICKENPSNKKDKEIEELKSKVDILQTKLDNQSYTKIGTINNIQNNITINLKSFGFENIAHLENDKEYMTQCLLNKDVMGLLENIHCDTDHPENQNVRIKSTKRELMETYVDGRWIVSDQEETLDELLNKGYRIMNFFSYKNKDHIVKECEDGEDEYHEMRDWLEELYSNSKVRKPLKRKLLILFMNNKALFLEKRTDDEPCVPKKQLPQHTENDSREHSDSDRDSDYEEISGRDAEKYVFAKIPVRFQNPQHGMP
jgi:hypothetical protein